jgi:conjugal transfer pilus assembly protein TraF
MAHSLKRFVFGCVLLINAVPAFADDRFYTDSDMPGYWWKKDPAEEALEEKQKLPEPVQPARKSEPSKKEPRFPKIADYTTRELYDMYPDQFVELMDDFKKQAVQRPTEENVYAYYKMQDVARRKSEAFENVSQYTMLNHPELSLEKEIPVTVPGKGAANEISDKEIKDMIANGPSNFGLLYFYQDNCPYCEAEKKILSFIVDRGWDVKPINIKDHPDLAARFNITVSPSLLLVKQGDERYIPMSYGVISFTDLAETIYKGVRFLNGETTPEQFNMRENQRGGGLDPLAPLK